MVPEKSVAGSYRNEASLQCRYLAIDLKEYYTNKSREQMFDGRFVWETSFASLQVSVFSKFFSDGSGTVCQYLETSQKFFEYISQFIGAPSRKHIYAWWRD